MFGDLVEALEPTYATMDVSATLPLLPLPELPISCGTTISVWHGPSNSEE